MAAYIICWLLFSADVVGSGLVPGPYQNDSSRFAICMCFQKFHECSGSWNPSREELKNGIAFLKNAEDVAGDDPTAQLEWVVGNIKNPSPI